ncbi:MAG TPA: YdiU family protein [Polaromonas sp.]|uniref:protein adenylyltransferase SelO n=1 Tax=Polaromonas sp. TaxID=1869339 RepID=UPI002D6D382F|nr:YdiU family protein [Polaromonas sp.]HYW58731.1 YdiU family protein [Polaromonas sp.]
MSSHVQDLRASLAPLKWSNRFAGLGPDFYTELEPTPLPAPYWVSRNTSLAHELGLDAKWFESPDALSVFTGNTVIEGSQPLASVYSGHQFGQWAGQLGDGRAILLGEIETPGGPQEIQLKGAGMTPYSRMGDGRAVLRSSIREYLCSEAMHGLGIPTTRALCVTGSDARVRREEIETAAVVTRTAPSFIRFGHFEHFSYSEQHDQLKVLADFVIDNFYPDCRAAAKPYAALLQAVSERTAHMVAAWQAVGFCHGVMNTDNMSILGLTIDYGPFQFLDAFDPGHVCNHSDTQGRYAYNKQPNIAYWNLFCLGQALLPLMDDQAEALAALESYKTVFPDALESRMRAKLGLPDRQPGDTALIEDTFKLLAANKVDYTIFWHRLGGFDTAPGREAVRDLFLDRAAYDAWALQYSERTAPVDKGQRADLMHKNNARYVFRNHLGEQAIRAAKLNDFSTVDTLLAVLQSPFEDHRGCEAYAGFPPDWASSIEISCSS